MRLLVCLWVLAATTVHAHGGLMETSSFTLRRGHPEDQLMAFTRGVLISRDSGQTWRWVCPEAMGYGSWIPESYVWLSNGDILTATGNALLRSRDGGCSWAVSPAFQGAWVTSIAEHPTDDSLLYASTGRPSVTNLLYRSRDGGETWSPTALRLEAVFSAVRVAPSDPKRLYVSGWKGYAMYLFRSNDAGETWEELPVSPGLPQGAYDLKLLSVSPARPDVLWVRVSSRSPAGGILYSVLRSDDGGRTLTPVLEQDDTLVNMDVSADGRTTWVATYNHFFRGREGQPSFEKLSLPTGNACVTRVSDVLYVCGSTWVHEWALARSSDEGTTWEPLFSLRDVRGAHQCPSGTPVADQCTKLWPQLAPQIDASPSPGPGASDGGISQPENPPKSEGCSAAAGNAAPASLLLLLVRGRGRRRANGRPRG